MAKSVQQNQDEKHLSFMVCHSQKETDQLPRETCQGFNLPQINKFGLRILLNSLFHTAIAKLLDLTWGREITCYPYSKNIVKQQTK